MSLDADLMVDRRRLRKQVTVWRILTALAVIAALLSGGVFAARQTGLVVAEAEHVARIRVAGMILPDRQLLETFDRVARSSNAKALLVEIDSPGGSAAASEAIHAAMRRVAERKPVVATIGSLGASGAYITAIGADHIVAQQTSLVGSIGVIVQWADMSDMLARLGIRFDEVKSTPLKATPSPFAPTSEEARAALRQSILDTYVWFTDLVKSRRGLDDAAMVQVSDGRVWTGRQAVTNRLVDAVGDVTTARDWLQRERSVPRSLGLVEYRPRREGVQGFLPQVALAAAHSLGVPSSWLPALSDPEARLDGLVSLWHPRLDLQ
jgi:protease IV